MDQDSFRKLLMVSQSESSTSSDTAGRLYKKAVLGPSQPAFQPRKVKNKPSELKYRDRASERRAGVSENDKVQSVLEDFEQQTTDFEVRSTVENYPKGDKDHDIPVKGLDLALLEQNKARATAASEHDEQLELTFQEIQTKSTTLKKRTREEIVLELKAKRASSSADQDPFLPVRTQTDDGLEEAKKIGKFRPIGAPTDLGNKDATKNPKGKETDRVRGCERKKKRRKAVDVSTDQACNTDPSLQSMQVNNQPFRLATSTIGVSLAKPNVSVAEQAVLHAIDAGEEDEDVAIFADVGEYEGMDFGKEEEDDDDNQRSKSSAEATTFAPSKPGEPLPIKGWFAEEPELISQPGLLLAHSPSPPPVPKLQEESGSNPPPRLAPLASSVLPSISDFLAMDAHSAHKKRREKKEKRKGDKKKVSTEVKANRDLKRLDSYVSKKNEGSAGI